MSYARAVLLLATLGLIACGGGGGSSGGGGGGGPTSNFATYQPAAAIIGQSTAAGQTQNNGNGTNLPSATGLEEVSGHVALGSLYVPDTKNNRIMGYATIPTGFGAAASFALGVPSFIVQGSGVVSATNFNRPAACCAAGGKLFVADKDFERVLIWNALPLGPAAANVALGKPDLLTEGLSQGQNGLSTVTDVCVVGSRVVVADAGNNRVMIWNSVPVASGVNADLVIGQPDFLTNSGATTAAKLTQPLGVWTDGTRLVVADSQNSRVLIWTTFPTSIGQPANLVLGQPDFVTATPGTGTTQLRFPTSVTSDGTQLFVCDEQNHRILIYSPFPTQNNVPPIRVLGQSNFTNGAFNDDGQDGIPDGPPSIRTMSNPRGVTAIGTQLFVCDTGNHRVLIFNGN